MGIYSGSTGQYLSQSLSRSSNSSSRTLGMALALASSIVLSPLYNSHYDQAKYFTSSSRAAFLLPMVLAVGLTIAIKISSSSSSSSSRAVPGSDPASWVLRIGSSSWGLAAVLVMLVFVLSWQQSAQEFFWR